MGAIATRFGRVGAEVVGHGATPVLFLHGVGSDKSSWARQQAFFSDHRRTIAIDYPGYGDSDPITGATAHTFADAALSVLDALDIRRAHVCGLSLGGIVALTLVDMAPDRVASLILADSFARHPEGRAIVDRSASAVREVGMEGLARSRASALLAQPADPLLLGEVIAIMAALDAAAYLQAADIVWLADLRAEARRVRCPTLILYGSADRITPPELSEELKELIPGAGLVEIAGAGHLSNMERSDTFNRVLAAFLTDVEASS